MKSKKKSTQRYDYAKEANIILFIAFVIGAASLAALFFLTEPKENHEVITASNIDKSMPEIELPTIEGEMASFYLDGNQIKDGSTGACVEFEDVTPDCIRMDNTIYGCMYYLKSQNESKTTLKLLGGTIDSLYGELEVINHRTGKTAVMYFEENGDIIKKGEVQEDAEVAPELAYCIGLENTEWGIPFYLFEDKNTCTTYYMNYADEDTIELN